MKPLRRSIANKTQKSLLEWDGKISLLLKLVFVGFVIWMGSVWVNHIPKPVGSMMDDVDVFEASGFENSDIENSDNEYGGSSSIHGELLGLRGAPRTYSGEYNEILPGKKYLVFQSSGGFSNQRGILSQFLELARMLNRTCIVPMITKHTSMWRVAWNVKRKNAFPADRLFDFPYMQSQGVDVVPLNVTLKEFLYTIGRENGFGSSEHDTYYSIIKNSSKDWFIHHDRNQVDRQNRRPRAFQSVKTWGIKEEKFIFMSGASGWQRLINYDVWRWKYTRFSPYFRGLAIRLSQQLFGGDYNAVHVRMGDYSAKRKNVKIGWLFSQRMLRAKFGSVSKNVYIATEPNTPKDRLMGITIRYNSAFSSDLDKDILAEFESLFTKEQQHIRNDILGNVEQLVCALGKKFEGTGFSTFSRWIKRLRSPGARKYLFPEAVASEAENDPGLPGQK